MSKTGSATGKIFLCITGWNPDHWLPVLAKHAPHRQVVTELDNPADPDVHYAVVWKQPIGILSKLPNLKAIFSLGAGVDHVFEDTEMPDVPIVRVIADDLIQRMGEYVVWQVLDIMRQGPLYRQQQADKIWLEDRHQVKASEITIGILGLGNIGLGASNMLKSIGFKLAGWSRTKKHVEGVEHFQGEFELKSFLASSDIVVCLLPLTPETKGMINAIFLSSMKRDGHFGGGVLINAGRGGLQVEADILAALDSGVLSYCALDVFETEPLAEDGPMWRHPRVMITPHAAAQSSPPDILPPMLRQMDAHDKGAELTNLVNRDAGY